MSLSWRGTPVHRNNTALTVGVETFESKRRQLWLSVPRCLCYSRKASGIVKAAHCASSTPPIFTEPPRLPLASFSSDWRLATDIQGHRPKPRPILAIPRKFSRSCFRKKPPRTKTQTAFFGLPPWQWLSCLSSPFGEVSHIKVNLPRQVRPRFMLFESAQNSDSRVNYLKITLIRGECLQPEAGTNEFPCFA